ncbi:hydrolase GDSL [Opitutaceae bacterium TAV5]|nr:hydrolase GDSL [Opitutaceae bacterium TAV5]
MRISSSFSPVIRLLSVFVFFQICLVQAAIDNRPVDTDRYRKPVRVVCAGDGLTSGIGTVHGQTYPEQLERMLGHGWHVMTYGSTGTTLLRKGERSWWRSFQYHYALQAKPDIVIIMLGSNDSRPQNWQQRAAFEKDSRELIASFRNLPTRPRIFICLPPYVPGPNDKEVSEERLRVLRARLQTVAEEENVGLIDNYAVTRPFPGDISRNLYPNHRGYARIAGNIYRVLTGKMPDERFGVGADLGPLVAGPDGGGSDAAGRN